MYVNPKGIKTLIVICLYIAQTWLRKLRFVNKKVHENMFINEHKQLDEVEY